VVWERCDLPNWSGWSPAVKQFQGHSDSVGVKDALSKAKVKTNDMTFKAKAKDLTLEAKAKDMPHCSWGASKSRTCPQRLQGYKLS